MESPMNFAPDRAFYRPRVLLALVVLVGAGYGLGLAESGPERLSDGRVVGPDDPQKGCIKCHDGEVRAWEGTTHFEAYDELDGSEKAEEILENLGFDDYAVEVAKCQTCHVTMYAEDEGDELEGKWGISCESCHGPASDWVDIHQDYGKTVEGVKITPEERAKETAEHRLARIASSVAAGMIRPENLYDLASNCMGCHSVPDPELVDVGGHTAGSVGFELVAWSQGHVRHNFLHGGKNEAAKPERLHLLYVIGKVVDLEFGLRGLSKATDDGVYKEAMMARVSSALEAISAVKSALGDAHSEVLAVIMAAGNEKTEAAADKVRDAGKALAESLGDGSGLAGISELLPDPSTYVVEKRSGR
jgi:hypothetical protein